MMRNVLQKQKVIRVVISFLSLSFLHFSLLGLYASSDAFKAVGANPISVESDGYSPPVQIASLENQAIKESSGIVASKRNTNVFWTHNDSGDGPFVYAFDRQGKHRGVWKVSGAEAQDWEDMAVGPGPIRGRSYLYLGDIGDNSKRRRQITVYRVVEPRITRNDSPSTVKLPRETEAADVIRLKYPDGKYDAETLLIHPLTGDLYILTKVRGAAARVYKLKAPVPKSGAFVLSYIGEFRFPNEHLGFITGGDISSDGHRVVICDYFGGCELILPEKRGTAFDEIWKQPPLPIDIGDHKGVRKQGEAICYRLDGRALLATSEGSPCPLIEIARRN